MTANASWHRIGVFTLAGVKTGARSFFLFSPAILLISALVMAIGTAPLPEVLPLFAEAMFFGLLIWLLVVIPYSALGALGGGILGLILAFQKKPLSSIRVGLVAVVIGVISNLLIHYRIWLSKSMNFHHRYLFLQYLLPIFSLKNLLNFFFFANPYFVPSTVTLALWFYPGSQMCKARIPEAAEQYVRQ